MSVPADDKRIYKGQDKEILIYLSGSTGLLDLTGSQVVLYIREVIDGTPVITKDSDNAGEIDIAPDQVANKGEATLIFVPADSSALSSGMYYYDLWLTDVASKTRPMLMGHFFIDSVGPSMIAQLRQVLDEAGELRRQVIKDELVYPATLYKLYLPRTRILSVEGVYILTDDTHAGTNYYDGGGFGKSTGVVWLGSPLVTLNQMVRADYTWESGISDDTILHHLESGKLYTINYTGITFDYGKATTNLTKGAEAMSLAVAMMACVLSVNGANVAQMGYNFRLDEFEIQTKLWGEGMIAEALFNQYAKEYEKWKMALGKAGDVLIATPDVQKYNLETLLGITDTTSEGGEGF